MLFNLMGVRRFHRKGADEGISGTELKELLDRDPVDMKAVEAKVKQLESLRTEMDLSIIRAIEEVKSKLSTEQREQFKRMMEMVSGFFSPVIDGMMRGGMKMPPPPVREEGRHASGKIAHDP